MQTATEIISNYRAVRSRLWGAPPKPVVMCQPPAPVVTLTSKPRRVDFKIIYVKPCKRSRRQSLPQGVFEKSLKAACKRWGEAPSEVLGKRRYRRCVLVRIDVINDLHNVGWSYAGIGRALKMDHSSVIHLHKKYTPDSGAYRRLVAKEERNPT